MSLALRELARRPGRFVPVGGALSLLVLLLLVLGGFLDGLSLGQTGSYRAQSGRLLVLSDDAELQLGRSRISAATRRDVEDVPEVGTVGGLGAVATTAMPPRTDTLQDVVVYGYELGTDVLPAPTGRGSAVVDRQLARVTDIRQGDVLELGPSGLPVVVAGFVDDVSQGAPTVWLGLETWRDVAADADPAAAPPQDTVAALVVTPAPGIALDVLATSIEGAAPVAATTVDEFIDALPVVNQQAAAFRGIIGVTFVVTLLVVALFFALLTLERVRLYAVLKAIGARNRDLMTGTVTQAVVVALVALVVGTAAALAFVALLPADLPVRLEPARALLVAGGTLLTALGGVLLTLRRILRVDPADAIG